VNPFKLLKESGSALELETQRELKSMFEQLMEI